MAFDGTLKFDTAIDKTGFESGIKNLGSLAQKGMAAVTAAVTVSSTAMAALGKSALDAYADYEQLTGGISTLFGAQDMSLSEYAESLGKTVDSVSRDYDRLLQAQDNVMKNAAAAFKTAGMSQNEYMETVTSFSASLISSLGGDTLKAAEIADMAIVDMSDNANKMGSSMESIQNAYQGFAKQNYTMLDNLKLGYGGTKSEMERLLADAEAISGIHYDISSYADVVEAIHVIQTQMGITGTTAKEASETISGSLSSLGAAWSNMVVGIADDTQDFDSLIDDLVESAVTAAENIQPRVETIIGGLTKFVSGTSELLADALVGITDFLPDMAAAGAELFSALIDGISDNIDAISSAALQIIGTLVTSMAQLAPRLIEAAARAVSTLAKNIRENLPQIKATARQLIIDFTDSLTESLPVIIEAAADILAAFIETIAENADVIIDGAVRILETLVTALVDNLDVLIDAAVQLVLALADYISENADELADTAIELIIEITAVLIQNAPKILAAAVILFGAMIEAMFKVKGELLMKLGEGLAEIGSMIAEGAKSAVSAVGKWFAKLPSEIASGLSDALWAVGDWGSDLLIKGRDAAKDLVDGIVTKIKELPGEMVKIGKALVEGLWEGIQSAAEWLGDKISDFGGGIVSGAKKVFRINSPSKLMAAEVGKPIAEGIGAGMTDNIPEIGREAVKSLEDISPEIKVRAVPDIDSSAYSALTVQSAIADTSVSEPSPTSDITNNVYNYSTVNNSAPADDKTIELHAQFIVGEEVVAEGVATVAADKIDQKQGVTVKLKERGLA
jgi:phage-related protein